jgi:hypothetical protein
MSLFQNARRTPFLQEVAAGMKAFRDALLAVTAADFLDENGHLRRSDDLLPIQRMAVRAITGGPTFVRLELVNGESFRVSTSVEASTSSGAISGPHVAERRPGS